MRKFKCEQCGADLAVPEDFTGSRARCKKCGQATAVPPPAESDDAGQFDINPPAGVGAEHEHADAHEEGAGEDQDGDFDINDDPALQDDSAEEPAEAGSPARAPASLSVDLHSAAGPERACPKCGAAVNPEASICVQCGHHLTLGVNVQTVAKARSAAAFTGKTGLAMIGGLVAAIIAGVVWAGIVTITNYEIGWVAIGVGFLVGIVMSVVARQQSTAVGVAAAGFAVLGLLIGKILIFQWAAPGIIAKELAADENMVHTFLFVDMDERRAFPPELQQQLDGYGEDDEWPEELSVKVRAAVQARYAAMTPAEREALTREAADRIVSNISFVEQLKNTLSGFDALWAILAVMTAFQVGKGKAE